MLRLSSAKQEDVRFWRLADIRYHGLFNTDPWAFERPNGARRKHEEL